MPTTGRQKPRLVRSMLRYALYFVVAAAVTLILTQQHGGGPEEGSLAPDFALARVDAPTQSLALRSLRGKPVLLEVFAGWCSSCRKAAPMLAELYRARTGSDVHFVGVSVDESLEQARATVASWKIPYPVLLDDGSFSRDYEIRSLPTFIAIDRAGQVRHVTSGVPWKRRLIAWLESIENSPQSTHQGISLTTDRRVCRRANGLRAAAPPPSTHRLRAQGPAYGSSAHPARQSSSPAPWRSWGNASEAPQCS